MKNLIESALEFLTANLKDKGDIFVGFSGGKDSIVTADLMKKSGLPFRLYYSVTGIDPPELVKFIRREYPECVFLRPNKTFWHHILTKNPPANFSRWCCTTLKKEPSSKLKMPHRVLGIRAEESAKRAKYKQIEYFKKLKQCLYYPIFHWNEGEIWEYIEENELVYPSLYDEGLSRIGCVICPYHSSGNGAGHNFYRIHWPKFFSRFEDRCKMWFEKRQNQGREMYFDTADEFIENWYRGNVRWYKREKIANQKTFEDYL